MVAVVTNQVDETWTQIITTGLNSLATAGSALSAAITTDGKLLMDISVKLASLTPTGSASLEIHALPLMEDATNYADLVSQNPATLLGTISFSTSASIKYGQLIGAPQPARAYKIGVYSSLGVSMAASLNIVSKSTYTQVAT
jgi:uncharacterized protein YcfJ